MHSKSKLAVMMVSAVVVFYAALVMFYGNVVAQGGGAYKEIAVFVDVLKKITDDYVDMPNMDRVLTGAMKGMLETLDPYGGFFLKEEAAEIERRMKTLRGEIGVVLSKKPELVYVVSVLSGSPAEQAGIRPGDFIVSLDGISTFNMHLLEVESQLRGQPGQSVSLGIMRSSQAEPIEIAVARQELTYPEIQQKLLSNDVGYLRPYHLDAASAEQFRSRLKTLQAAGAGKVLLDLRYVAGGDFGQALEIANFFIAEGLLAYTEGKERPRKDYLASGSRAFCDLPMAVLVNSATSGAAEVIAGAIKDRQRGKIVGEKTYGTGSRQERLPLQNGSVLVLTTERYFTPSGKAIQEETARQAGIHPDVVAPEDKVRSDLVLKNYLENRDQDSQQGFKRMMETIDSLQLQKALEVLETGKTALQKAA